MKKLKIKAKKQKSYSKKNKLKIGRKKQSSTVRADVRAEVSKILREIVNKSLLR